jgi:alkanesulfonate monooxygenase SsuD/methylene tetrahydromethanopterin reductase-like flavin-dependent oxidoreductase (luciferase family)
MVRLAEDRRADGAGSGRCPSFREIAQVARRMERAGMDSIWVADHLLYRPAGQATIGIWESWTMLSALAVVTRRMELGTLVLAAPFRNPAILAKMAATLDEVSGGRLILGIGAGWNEAEFRAFDVPLDHLAGRFEEALQIIVPLLREGRVDFSGRFYSARDCEIRPRGPRPEGPPLMIGAEKPRMLKLAARYGDMWNTGYCGRVDTFVEKRATFEAARADVPGADAVQLTVLLKVGWADLGELPGFFGDDYLTGSAESIAEALHEYAQSGVAHVIFQYHPNSAATLGRLLEAVKTYKSGSRAR